MDMKARTAVMLLQAEERGSSLASHQQPGEAWVRPPSRPQQEPTLPTLSSRTPSLQSYGPVDFFCCLSPSTHGTLLWQP